MKYLNIGQCKLACFTTYEAKRLPTHHLGRNARIHVPEVLLEDKRLSKYVNNNTMGALDNYAEHEKLNIYISPLEHDLFDDLKVSVFGEKFKQYVEASFYMAIPQGKEGFFKFIRSLYSQVSDTVKKYQNSR